MALLKRRNNGDQKYCEETYCYVAAPRTSVCMSTNKEQAKDEKRLRGEREREREKDRGRGAEGEREGGLIAGFGAGLT